jgi:hypothetical protein
MGQAFDKDGAILGEAYGETKRDVFDKLIAEHPNADEIRIKSMRDKAEAATAGQAPPSGLGLDPLRQFFVSDHLPPQLQMISRTFSDMADFIINRLPRNPERTVALRKLLEAKDCAVRAQLMK